MAHIWIPDEKHETQKSKSVADIEPTSKCKWSRQTLNDNHKWHLPHDVNVVIIVTVIGTVRAATVEREHIRACRYKRRCVALKWILNVRSLRQSSLIMTAWSQMSIKTASVYLAECKQTMNYTHEYECSSERHSQCVDSFKCIQIQ